MLQTNIVSGNDLYDTRLC